MGVTTSKDRNRAQYQLYEDPLHVRVNSLSLCRQSHQGQVPLPPHERSTSPVGHGTQSRGIQATRTADDPCELVFESTSQYEVVHSVSSPPRAQQASFGAAVDLDQHTPELSWICDPVARRKTSRTSFLRVAVEDDEVATLSMHVSLLSAASRKATLSLAYATSPEDLERILAERKRGNVSWSSALLGETHAE